MERINVGEFVGFVIVLIALRYFLGHAIEAFPSDHVYFRTRLYSGLRDIPF